MVVFHAIFRFIVPCACKSSQIYISPISIPYSALYIKIKRWIKYKSSFAAQFLLLIFIPSVNSFFNDAKAILLVFTFLFVEMIKNVARVVWPSSGEISQKHKLGRSLFVASLVWKSFWRMFFKLLDISRWKHSEFQANLPFWINILNLSQLIYWYTFNFEKKRDDW